MSQRSWVADIEDLHQKFGGLAPLVEKMDPETRQEFWDFRKRFLNEELGELILAKTAEDAVDAIIDLMVVAIGTLDAFGVDQRRAWDIVHHANMSKSPGANPNRPNQFGLPDLIKPPGWIAPSHSGNVGLLAEIYSEGKDS